MSGTKWGFRILVLTTLVFFFLVFTSIRAEAGLIIDVDLKINGRRVHGLEIQGNNLVVIYSSSRKIIELPENALELVTLWASQNTKGPFIFSIDAALVTGGNDYFPGSVDRRLGYALLGYDSYAHTIAIGGLPTNTDVIHPLVVKTGDDSALPHLQHLTLLDSTNLTAKALWYKHMTARHILPPNPVGELTILAMANKRGFPVRLQIKSHRWLTPSKWYRGTDVPSAWDRWAFGLPFQLLKGDMEERWQVYRDTFKPLDELSSIVEAYAILDAVERQNGELWNRFIKKLPVNNKGQLIVGSIIRSSEPFSWPVYMKTKPWIKLSIQSVGEKVETSAEANLALSLILEGVVNQNTTTQWLVGIRNMAMQNPRIRAKFLLAMALTFSYEPETAIPYVEQFFEVTRISMDFFRLRVQGFQLLRETEISNGVASTYSDKPYSNGPSSFSSFFDKERTAILEDFKLEASEHCTNNDLKKSDFVIWEDLSQNIFSVNLLRLAEEEYGEFLEPEFSNLVACILYNRGVSFQVGLELAYRHANFRFLKYLADRRRQDSELLQKIHTYRSRLADLMGLEGWEENNF